MSIAVPIARSSRQVTRAATAGQTVFSYDAGPVWDLADLVVQRKIAPATRFTTISSGFTLALVSGGLGGATATFSVAPRPTSGDPAVDIRITSRRVHERETDVSRSERVHTPSLETEHDKITTTLQELRRDVDEATAEAAAVRDELVYPVLGQIPDGSLVLAKHAPVDEARFLGRAENAGTGDVTALTAAQAQAILEAPWTQPKPMFPFASVQTGGTGFARMDRNTYLKQALWVVENDVDDARFDGGISSYIFQSVSKTVQGTNIMGVALPLAAGATVVRSAGNVELYADNKTLCLQCDDGTIHEARTTGISGSDISFTPALPTGKTLTPDGSTRQVSWGRAGSLTATAASGANSIQCSSILGITAPGERIRIPLDNGNTHLTTVSSFSAPFTIGLTDPLPSQASAGKIAYVGPHDVDPNIIISRRAVRGVPGDILAALNFTGPSSTAQTNVDVQYAQVYVEIEESSFVTGVRGRIAFCTANPLSTVGTTGVRYYIGQGLYSVDPILGIVTGGDKGPGTINVHAAYVNNAPIPSAISSPANGRLARWSFDGAGLQDGSIFDGALQQRMAVGSAIDFVHREAIRCAVATTWATVRTLTPSTVTNVFANGRVTATVCGFTDTLGGGSTRQEWAFAIANGAPTVSIIGSASNAGAAAPQFRLNVSGNTIQIQIQSNDATNILRNALMALEVIAPDGPANLAGYTMAVS